MKYLFIVLCFLFCYNGNAQNVKIVFDVTSSDVEVHQSALRHVNAMSEAYPDSEFEVVIYSGALPFILKDKSTMAEEVKKAVDKPNVKFVVCQMALKKHNLDETHLLAGVGTVPDGILEIIQKQQEGWGYIKEAK